MSRPHRPPRAARWLLGLWVDRAELEDVWVDISAAYARRVGRDGRLAALRWLAREVRSSFEPWAALRAERAEGPIARPSAGPRGRPPMLDRLIRDVTYSLRALRRRPLFTGTAIITLAIGIGANTAIFSVVNGVFLKGVPGLDDTDGLVEVTRMVDGEAFDMSFPVVDHLRETSAELEDIAALTQAAVALGFEGEADVVTALSVTDNYFAVLGLRPAAGRFFFEGEARYPRVGSVAVVSHRFAERRFASVAEAVGSTIRVNGHPTEIIGVTAPGFGGHAVGLRMDVWLPLGLPAPGLRTTQLARPESGIVEAIGRLTPGSTVDRARAETAAIATAFLEDATGRSYEENPYVVRIDAWAPVPAIIREGVRAFLIVLMVLVGLVLAMACMNVSGMSLSRIAERSPELAVRQVLGAGRRRIVRQLLVESMVLYGLGAAGGLLIAVWASGLLQAFDPPVPIPGFDLQLDLGVDWRVMGFGLAIAVASGLAFSILPALRGADHSLTGGTRDGGAGPRRQRLRSVLVAAQMGTTVLLLVGAGLFVRALGTLRSVDTGWETGDVVVVDFDLELTGYSDDEGAEFYETLRERVAGLPGVEAAGLSTKLPLGGRSSFGDISVPGFDPAPGRVGFTAYNATVSPGYFDALELELVEGRGFEPEDARLSNRIVVVNKAMADRFWPEVGAAGRYFEIGDTRYDVVGVVEDARYSRLIEETYNFYYIPSAQRHGPQMVLYAKGSDDTDPAGLISAIRAAVAAIDPDQPTLAARPLEEAIEIFLLPQRVAAWIATVMGTIALLLGAVGVYGITAFTVARREREIGIRLALGASRGAVVGRMMRTGLVAPGVGILIGTAIAVAATRFLSSFLAGVSPLDLVTFGAVLVGLALVAIGAVTIPTRRASGVDPAETLRAD